MSDLFWAECESRDSRNVFVGRNLDCAALLAALASCIAQHGGSAK